MKCCIKKKICLGIFRPMAFFISANMRKCMNDGRGDAVPIFLHDIPFLFERKIIPVDVSIISVRYLTKSSVHK